MLLKIRVALVIVPLHSKTLRQAPKWTTARLISKSQYFI